MTINIKVKKAKYSQKNLLHETPFLNPQFLKHVKRVIRVHVELPVPIAFSYMLATVCGEPL